MDVGKVNKLKCRSLLTVGVFGDLLVQVIYEVVILDFSGFGCEDLLSVVVRIQFDVIGVP